LIRTPHGRVATGACTQRSGWQVHHAIGEGEDAGGRFAIDDYTQMPANLDELFQYYRWLGDDEYELVLPHGDLIM